MCRGHRFEDFRNERREARESWKEARREARRRWREAYWGEEAEASSDANPVNLAALARAVEKLASRIEVLERIVTTDSSGSEARLAAEIESLRGAGASRGAGAEGHAP